MPRKQEHDLVGLPPQSRPELHVLELGHVAELRLLLLAVSAPSRRAPRRARLRYGPFPLRFQRVGVGERVPGQMRVGRQQPVTQ